MSILLNKIVPKPLVTDDENRTLTGAQYSFTEPPIMEKALVLRPRATPPTDALSQQEGSIYYDSDDKIYYFYDGTTWTSLVQAIGGTPLFSPSTDNRVVRFDGVGGSLQDSPVTIADSGNMSGLGTVTASGLGTFVGVSTDSIQAPSGTVSFSGDHIDDVNILDATTARVTTLQTENLTAAGTTIDCTNKSLSNINTLTATTSVTTADVNASGTVTAGVLNSQTLVNVSPVTVSSSDAVRLSSGTDNVSFEGNTARSVKGVVFSTSNATTDPILTSTLGVEALARFALTGDGSMKFTNGTASIFGTQAFLSKVPTTGALQIGFTTGARDGNLCLGGLLGGGAATTLNIDNSSGDITMGSDTLAVTTTGNTTLTCSTLALAPSVSTTFNSKPVTGITNLTATGTISGAVVNASSTVVTAALQQLAGNDTLAYLRVPSIFYKQTAVFGSTAAGGVQSVWSRTINAGSLTTYGDCIRIYVQGRTGNTANTKFLRFTVAGTNYDSNNFSTPTAKGIIFRALISYATATTYNINYEYYDGETLNKINYGETVAIANWSSTNNTISLSTSTGTTVNDIVIRNTLIEIM